jgi:hypothetical protein
MGKKQLSLQAGSNRRFSVALLFIYYVFGSLTMENQYSSMDLTTFMNWLKSTGFVM